jgi:hypothetical protein
VWVRACLRFVHLIRSNGGRSVYTARQKRYLDAHTSHNTRVDSQAAAVIHSGLDAGYGQFTRDSAN